MAEWRPGRRSCSGLRPYQQLPSFQPNNLMELGAMKFHEQRGVLAGRFSFERTPAPAPAGFVTRGRCPLRMPSFLAQECPPKSTTHSARCTGPRQATADTDRGRKLSIAFRRRVSSFRWEAEGGSHPFPPCRWRGFALAFRLWLGGKREVRISRRTPFIPPPPPLFFFCPLDPVHVSGLFVSFPLFH